MNSVTETFSVNESALLSNRLLGLTEIFEPDSQIAVVERAHIPAIDTYLTAASYHLGEGFRLSLKSGESLPLNLLPAYPGREAFASDITFLVQVYGDLLGCPAVGLRIELLHRAMCPRFHVDHTGIRMLCTYRGPGTEWLLDACADRSKLGPIYDGMGDDNSGIITNPAGIRQVAPYAIALLKGRAWQGNAGRGLIHRSPAVSTNTTPRVLLALDALW